MAKSPVETRAPVTARGLDLLRLIAAAPNGVLMLTQEEGNDIVQAGHAVVDGANTEGNTAAVSLTPAGQAALAAAPKITVRTDIPVPVKVRAKKAVKYPIEALEVGQSFHIPKTEKVPDPVASIQSTVSNARAKFAVGVVDDNGKPVMETVTVREYEKDSEGKLVKDSDGKRILKSSRQEDRQKMKITRDFYAKAVGKDDPDGEGARIWRTQ